MRKKKFQKIYVEIINICNMKCSFCKETKRPKKIMQIEEFDYIISKIKLYTDLIALHVKGEPLMHPNLKEILEICEKYDIHVNITTNGTLLYENIDILKKSKALRQINISLHSMNKNSGKQIKTLEKYMEDIFKAVRILKENNKPYISYRLWNLEHISKNEENLEILNILEKEYKVENLIEKAKENQFVKLYEKIFLNQDIEFEWPDINSKIISDKGSCLGLRNQIAILSNGDVVPCCLDQDANIKLGNIFLEDLETILSRKISIEIVQGFENNKLIHNLCKKCGFNQKIKNQKILENKIENIIK